MRSGRESNVRRQARDPRITAFDPRASSAVNTRPAIARRPSVVKKFAVAVAVLSDSVKSSRTARRPESPSAASAANAGMAARHSLSSSMPIASVWRPAVVSRDVPRTMPRIPIAARQMLMVKTRLWLMSHIDGTMPSPSGIV